MARSTGSEDTEEIRRIVDRRRRISVSALQLQTEVPSQPQRSIHRSQTIQHSQVQRRTFPSSMANEEADSHSNFGLESEYDNAGGSISVVLTDPDMLDCPICVHPLCYPIYQCELGHVACSSCCVKAKNKCPSCCLPIGFIRCLAMEKLSESVRVECKNKLFGCKETLIYNKKAEHETTCPHTLCYCPLPSCGFSSSSKHLYDHFLSRHPSSATSFTYDSTFRVGVEISQKHVILQEQNEGVIFILNHEVQGHGRVFSVDCIGPSTCKNAFVYQLSVKCTETSLSIETVPEVCAKRKQQHTPDSSYLTIPLRYLDFLIQVRIKKANRVE